MTSVAGAPLQNLGATRSRRAPAYLLQTPDTFVWAPLHGMHHAAACVHTSPALGAGFAQYSISFEAGGFWKSVEPTSRFVYVLSGEVRGPGTNVDSLTCADFFYAAPFQSIHLETATGARVVVIEKAYVPMADLPKPHPLSGNAAILPSTPLLGDEAVQVRSLLPADLCYDFAVNTMTYQPGARLSMVEVHVMEHGLLMLEGEGIYRLGDDWHPVTAGDFIWMAPYCPQWFGAFGSSPAKYLIYKDWNRAPMAAASHP